MAYVRSEAEIMEKIRRALALAQNCEEGSPEYVAAMRSANGLMTKHAIDMAKLDASRTVGEKRVPTQMRFKLMGSEEAAWQWMEAFRLVLSEICRTNRCRAILHPGYRQYDITIVGMQEDVEWCQMLWMQIFMDFVSKISPKWEWGLGIGENVARLKEAGMKWEVIWNKAKDAEPELDNLHKYDPKGANYLMRHYKKFLRENPDRPQIGTQRFEAYRYSFVEAFCTTVSSRLEQMRADSAQEVETSGSAVALLDVSHRVDEMFFDLFPSQRPKTEEEMQAMRQEWEREERERIEKDRLFLQSLSEKERERVLRERQAKAEKDAKNDEKYWRRKASEQARLQDGAGYQAGRRAGTEANLAKGAVRVDTAAQKGELEG